MPLALDRDNMSGRRNRLSKVVTVTQPTRLDWTFVLSNQSVVDPPAEWLQGYDSQQRYELFVPPAKAKKDGLPVILFISAGDAPAGWDQLESVCKQKGIVFTSVRLIEYGPSTLEPALWLIRLHRPEADSARTLLGATAYAKRPSIR
jgi:hypothetical protein